MFCYDSFVLSSTVSTSLGAEGAGSCADHLLVCPRFVLSCFTTFEPPHDKTNEMACAPSEDSDQPGHPPSLIRVFTIRVKIAWVLSYR